MSRVGKQFKVVSVSVDYGGEPDHGFEIGTVVTCILDDGSDRCLCAGMAGNEGNGCNWEEGKMCALWVNDCDLEEVNND